MVKFAVYARIKLVEREKFLAALREYLPSVANEPDTIQYDVCEAASAPGTFLFYEAYSSEDAVTTHQESDAFKAYIGKIGPMLDEPPISMKLLESAKG